MLDELLAIGDRVVAMAQAGEQVEAVVVSGRDTEIRVYESEIESLSSAESQGVGIRLIKDGKQGFAYAGTLDDDVLAEALGEARDNAVGDVLEAHAAVPPTVSALTRRVGWPSPTGTP